MQSTRNLKLYVVVEVWHGIAAGVNTFRRFSSAQKYLRRVRRKINSAEDDAQLFECPIRIANTRIRR